MKLQPAIRLALSILGVAACLFGIWTTGRAGFAALLTYGALAGNLDAANAAVRLAPSNPDAHRNRAALLRELNAMSEAQREMEMAVSLRPRDHTFWVELAIIKDDLKDPTGSLAAFDEAIRLAPFYAYPRWQRGNLLLRLGRLYEAFADLRRAAESDPTYIPNVIDLAWAISKGDTNRTELLAQISTGPMRIAFAELLAKRGRAPEAVSQFAKAGAVSDQARHNLTRQLIAANAFNEAFEVWRSPASVSPSRAVEVYDGGFEAPLTFDEFGFSWRVPRQGAAVKLATDSTQVHSGSRSLAIEFLGDSRPEAPLVSQLIPVAPSRRYRVSFAGRTQNIVTGGLPFAIVTDAASEAKLLGESAALRENTAGWEVMSFEFQTEASTSAIILSVRRKSCPTSPCPIFGSTWLDSFSIEEVK